MFHADRWLAFSTAVRGACLATFLACCAAGICLFVWRPLSRVRADREVATLVERRYPALNERLLTTVEVAPAGSAAGMSASMIGALARETAAASAGLRFAQAVPLGPHRNKYLAGAAALTLLAFHAVLWPGGLTTWARRMFLPAADIPVYARTRVWVRPSALVVPRGEGVDILVRTEGQEASSATLKYRIGGGAWQSAALSPSNTREGSPNVFGFRLRDLRETVALYAIANDGRSNRRTVRVEERPAVRSVRIQLDYPDYTGRPDEEISASAGNLVAPEGTRAVVTLTATKPLERAILRLPDAAETPVETAGADARFEITVAKSGQYAVELVDRNGFTAQPAPSYAITAVEDKRPEVRIASPNADIERSPNGWFDLRAVATDDYGVQSMAVQYRVGKRSGSLPLPFAANSTPKNAAAAARVNLAGLGLKDGDVLSYEVTARDGNAVKGPRQGKSASYKVTIVGAQEMKQRIEQETLEQSEALKQLVKQQRAAMEELARARRGDAQAPLVRRAEAAQRNVAAQARSVARQMTEALKRLDENGLATQSQQSRMSRAAQALERLANGPMTRAAEAIKSADNKNTAPLDSAAQAQQDILEELRRLAEEAAPVPDAARLAAEVDRLATEQQRLADLSRVASEPMDTRAFTAAERENLRRLAARQAELARQTQGLLERAKEAAEAAAEQQAPGARDMQEAVRQAQQSRLTENQQRARSRLEAQDPREAAPAQEKVARDLRDMADRLGMAGLAQRSAEEAGKQAERLEEIADKLQQTAEAQRNLTNRMAQAADKAQQQQAAQQQQQLREQARRLESQLDGAAAAQQQVQRAQRHMSEAEQQLGRGREQEASQSAREAVRRLLEAAMEARESARNAASQQDTARTRAEVERLARDQRTLEAETERVDNLRSQDPNSRAAQERADNAARAQERLLNRAQQLAQEMPSNAFKWATGEAARRMENAARALQQRNTSADTRRNQEHAAETLDRLARALAQEESGDRQQNAADQAGSQQGSTAQSDAGGELQLAREMQAQIRQETTSIDRRRDRNPGRQLSADQQRELNYLNQAQRTTREIAERAAQQLRGEPRTGQRVSNAARMMEDVAEDLRRAETGQPTQSKQEQIVAALDAAIQEVREAMRQQQQQMARQQQSVQNAGQMAQQQPGGQQPGRETPRIVQAQPGAFGPPGRGSRSFGGLDPRAQQSLRQGQQERVPAEYRDLVKQYYRALSEGSRR